VNSTQDLSDFGIGAGANYLLEQMQAIAQSSNGNFSVSEHNFTATYNNVSTPQRNIVGVLGGTDAEAGVIVVGAHYDSRSWDLRDFAAYAPGADDNASGVSAVLEIARIMSQSPRKATILFVLFSAEEVQRQGSIAFVQDYLVAFDMEDVIMLNLDTIGSWNDSQGNINSRDIRLFSAPPNTSEARHIARTLNFMAYHHNLDLNISVQDALDRPDRYGDHFSFHEAGYPALRFIEALEDDDNREGADTIEHIEPAYLTASTRTILGVLEGLSDGILPPKNISFRNLGDGTASTAWEPSVGATGYVVALRKSDSLIFDRHFIIEANRTAPWDGWWEFDSFAIAAIDSRGVVGRFSMEISLSR
jgi:leucyl aminopeptidase